MADLVQAIHKTYPCDIYGYTFVLLGLKNIVTKGTYLRDEGIYAALGDGNESETEGIDYENIEPSTFDSMFLDSLLSEQNTDVQQESNNKFCAPATPVTSSERKVIASQAS
ncbi:hypothetical protein EVAR_2253_1 [Eumeta japonica]|uniref:Uncharacterized protein n=1 Tax=Eumeta variegata TaxID=151549 RepID=A0A4C1SFK3_EUMVA|nr:hypothetical protein EVAR_2253_1 [Eumeta japonica]